MVKQTLQSLGLLAGSFLLSATLAPAQAQSLQGAEQGIESVPPQFIPAPSLCNGPITPQSAQVVDMVAHRQYENFPDGLLYVVDPGRPWLVGEVRYPAPGVGVQLIGIDEQKAAGVFQVWSGFGGCFPASQAYAFETNPALYIAPPAAFPLMAALPPVPVVPNSPGPMALGGAGTLVEGGGAGGYATESNGNQVASKSEQKPKEDKPTENTGCGSAYRGVNDNGYATAISGIEGGYTSASDYIPNQGTRALGRYQYLGTRKDVQQEISKNPGGSEFLKKVNSGQLSKSEVQKQLPKYWSPEQQDAFFQKESHQSMDIASKQTDPKTGKPFTGDRLIERAAQIHFGGPSARKIDSGATDLYGRLTIYTYGKTALSNYKKAIGKQKCSKSADFKVSMAPVISKVKWAYESLGFMFAKSINNLRVRG